MPAKILAFHSSNIVLLEQKTVLFLRGRAIGRKLYYAVASSVITKTNVFETTQASVAGVTD